MRVPNLLLSFRLSASPRKIFSVAASAKLLITR